LYPGLLITRRIKVRRTLRTKRREIRYGFNTGAYHFRYPLDRLIGRKKNITLDREILAVKY
jgi:hypothetical protein